MALFRPFQNVDFHSITRYFNQISAMSLGAIGRYISAAGISPASTGADIVLAVLPIPAGALGVGSDQLEKFVAFAQGKFGATANSKRLKIIANPTTAVVGSAVVGGTTILDTGAVTTNGGGFSLAAWILRSGVNAQLGITYASKVGAVDQGTIPPVALAIVDGAAFNIAITGNATTAASDILLNVFEVAAES